MKKKEFLEIVENLEPEYISFAEEWYGNYQKPIHAKELLRKLETIQTPRIFEYIGENYPVNMYFDIDIKNNNNIDWHTFESECTFKVKNLINYLLLKFQDFEVQTTQCTAHCPAAGKYSVHLVMSLTHDGVRYMFSSSNEFRRWIQAQKAPAFAIIDINVYKDRGGLFRTIFSHKPRENRPFIPVTEYDETNVFVTYRPRDYSVYNDNIIPLPTTEPTPTCNVENDSNVSKQTSLCAMVKVGVWHVTCLEKFLELLFQLLFKKTSTVTIYSARLEEDDTNGPTYSVLFHGICINTGEKHRSNNNMFKVNRKNFFINCLDTECGKGRSFRTKDYMSTDAFNLLFPSLDIHLPSSNAENFIRSEIDPYACLDPQSDGFVGDTTEAIYAEYGDFYPGKHVVKPNNYFLMKSGSDKQLNISSWRNSELYNLLQKPVHANVNINIGSLHKHEHIHNTATPTTAVAAVGSPGVPQKLSVVKDADLFIQSLVKAPVDPCVVTHMRDWLTTNSHVGLYKAFYAGARAFFEGLCPITENQYYYCEQSSGLWEKISVSTLNNLLPVRLDSFLRETLEHIRPHVPSDQIFNTMRNEIFLSSQSIIRRSNSLLGVIFDEKRKVKSEVDVVSSIEFSYTKIAFKNGVLDLASFSFVAGNPVRGDYIHSVLPYDYVDNYEDAALNTLLENLFPLLIERNYFLYLCSTLINLNVINNHLIFLIGKGSNGKSLFTQLLFETLGHLSSTVSSNFFSRTEVDPSIPQPDLLHIAQRLCAICSEPKECKFKSNVVKRFCGMDTISARSLYDKGLTSFTFRTKLLVVTNTVPTFTTNDDALWRRVVVVPFNTVFVDNPTQPNERKADSSLFVLCKGISMKQALMSKLVSIARSGIVPPQPASFEYDLTEWKTSAREFESFLSNFLVYTADTASFVSFSSIVEHYYEWAELGAVPAASSIEYRALVSRIKQHVLFNTAVDKRGDLWMNIRVEGVRRRGIRFWVQSMFY